MKHVGLWAMIGAFIVVRWVVSLLENPQVGTINGMLMLADLVLWLVSAVFMYELLAEGELLKRVRDVLQPAPIQPNADPVDSQMGEVQRALDSQPKVWPVYPFGGQE